MSESKPQLCSRCRKPLTVLGGWVVKRGGVLVCKECDFKAARPFRSVRCPSCGREINSLRDALAVHYLDFEEKWEVLCHCHRWVSCANTDQRGPP